MASEKYFASETDRSRYIHVDLVGIGPGDESQMTYSAAEAVRSAEIIFGADRMVHPYTDRRTYP